MKSGMRLLWWKKRLETDLKQYYTEPDHGLKCRFYIVSPDSQALDKESVNKQAGPSQKEFICTAHFSGKIVQGELHHKKVIQ